MKALTVRQPYASAIMGAGPRKNIENREWNVAHRGAIAIHSGLNLAEQMPAELHPDLVRAARDPRNRGVILGTVEIKSTHEEGSAECIRHECEANPWAMWGLGIFHWMLENPRPFATPIRARGALKLWEPTPSVAHLITIAEVVE